ncbi:MAG: adenylosuccinate synthase [Anaerolineae bacterium]|jgi:adenylosuccinate synthase|nr:adenylosuccinate synthase [Anaerolineae bacterium]MBT7071322.1 adenylosuccinate synthase [Anaerolineae bacterium]MBT7324162.1 adenylosuccinate synthase [Anaerolineae bacterium]
MTVRVVLGTQWGDEGKGKAIDVFAKDYDYVARYNGGNNAGHTIVNEFGTFKIHLVPSGVFAPQITALIGGGVVMDPSVLVKEIASLQDAGINLEGRLFISPRAHLIMPYHKILDGLYEAAKGTGATGTTKRGIGPTFADKVSYNGIRWSDFADLRIFESRLTVQIEMKNKIITALGGEALNFAQVRDIYLGYYEEIKPFIRETYPMVLDGLRDGKNFLLEQANGSLLDTDWGTYPFVTGSTTLASAATAGLGVPPRAIDSVIGIAKAYTTRVGGGPLPTEIFDDKYAISVLSEIAATTGRTRRAGWFDSEVTRFAAQVNGVTQIFLTKLDILSAFDEVKVCTGYELDGKPVHYYDIDSYQLGRVEPVFRSMPGWKTDITGVRDYADLPQATKDYVDVVEELLEVPVGWVSLGPEREALVEKK